MSGASLPLGSYADSSSIPPPGGVYGYYGKIVATIWSALLTVLRPERKFTYTIIIIYFNMIKPEWNEVGCLPLFVAKNAPYSPVLTL